MVKQVSIPHSHHWVRALWTHNIRGAVPDPILMGRGESDEDSSKEGLLLTFQPRSLAMQPARCLTVLPAVALTLALELAHNDGYRLFSQLSLLKLRSQ